MTHYSLSFFFRQYFLAVISLLISRCLLEYFINERILFIKIRDVLGRTRVHFGGVYFS